MSSRHTIEYNNLATAWRKITSNDIQNICSDFRVDWHLAPPIGGCSCWMIVCCDRRKDRVRVENLVQRFQWPENWGFLVEHYRKVSQLAQISFTFQALSIWLFVVGLSEAEWFFSSYPPVGRASDWADGNKNQPTVNNNSKTGEIPVKIHW